MIPQDKCSEYGELISAAVDDELEAAEWLQLDNHLQKCDSCCQLFEQYREMEQLCRVSTRQIMSPGRSARMNGHAKVSLKPDHPGPVDQQANPGSETSWFRLAGRLVPLAAAATVVVALFWIAQNDAPSQANGQQAAPLVTPLAEMNELNLARQRSQQQQGDVMGLELRALRLELGQLKDQSAAEPLIHRIDQLLAQIESNDKPGQN